MKVKLDVSPDSIIKVDTDEDGTVLSIEFEPMFAKSKGVAILAYGIVQTDKGKLVDRFALSVSGATGLVRKTGRAEPVKAAIDNPGAGPAEEDDEDEEEVDSKKSPPRP